MDTRRRQSLSSKATKQLQLSMVLKRGLLVFVTSDWKTRLSLNCVGCERAAAKNNLLKHNQNVTKFAKIVMERFC